jgi:hypothetical protein
VGEISVKTGNNARNGGKNSLNRLIRCVCGKKSAQIREILISESAWEEMTCLFAPSLINQPRAGTPALPAPPPNFPDEATFALTRAVEWLTDNGSCYIADATKTFAASLGFIECTTPVRSPESNGMAESFVKTFKRDYVYVNALPDAMTVMGKLTEWMEDYNNWHPHKWLKMQSPREYRSSLLAIN